VNKKTNAVRIVESHNIPYELKYYDVDEEDLTGITVAAKIGMDPDSVFKTLVASGDANNILVFSVPVTTELNLKAAASASGNKKIEMVKVKDLLPLTGYIRGGCSPIGMKKKYPFFIDQTASLFDRISVSAGARGVQIVLNLNDLLKVTEGILADII
jgi:Cys-tRNA(Pro)/Cys-tRNA(Cys) deacylase